MIRTAPVPKVLSVRDNAHCGTVVLGFMAGQPAVSLLFEHGVVMMLLELWCLVRRHGYRSVVVFHVSHLTRTIDMDSMYTITIIIYYIPSGDHSSTQRSWILASPVFSDCSHFIICPLLYQHTSRILPRLDCPAHLDFVPWCDAICFMGPTLHFFFIFVCTSMF